MSDHRANPSLQSGFLGSMSRFAPLEVWILALLGTFYHFFSQIHFDDFWDPKLMYDHRMRFLLPMAFGIAMVYAYVFRQDSLSIGRLKVKWYVILEMALGLAAVGYVVFADPIIYVDDVGFILRYLDNFREGCFYCFNQEDGPVFGISSFIYGLLAGIMSMLHLASPEGIINFLTYCGIFAFVVVLFRLMREVVNAPGLAALLVILVIANNKSVQMIFNSGMESPVHLSIVLAALLFYLQRKDRLMWLFLALATISKLDVVPLVVVTGIMWLIDNHRELRPASWNNPRWRAMLLYGGVPVVIWVVFALLVFGSPLPQSAYAKVYYHHHPDGDWFPFLGHFLVSAYRRPLFWVMFILFVLQVGATSATRKRPSGLIFGFCYIATMVLYYFYNPGEQMQWYYTLPETLMLLQLAASFHWLFEGWKTAPRTLVAGFLLGGAFLFTWSQQMYEVREMRRYEYVVELERKRIGEYLGQEVQEGDSLLAGHGLISRHAQGYVIDQTGLNSRLTTDFRRNTDSLIRVLRPEYIVMHGYRWEVDKINNFPYVPDTAFYDISGFWYPTWRVFKRADNWENSMGLYAVNEADVSGHEVHFINEMHYFLHAKGDTYVITRQDLNPRERFLTMGIFRQDEDYTVRIRDIYPGDSVVADYEMVVGKYTGRGSSITHSLTIPLQHLPHPDSIPPGPRRIELSFRDNQQQVEVTDIMVAIARRD